MRKNNPIPQAPIKTGRRLSSTLAPLLAFAILLTAQLGCNLLGETTTPATLVAQTLTPKATITSPAPTSPVDQPPTEAPPFPQSTPTSPPTITPAPAPDYFSQAYPLSPVDYLIPLTVRHVSEAGAVLFFELRSPASGRLVYRAADPGYPIQGEVEIPASQNRHMVALEGLSPGVAYQAMVLLGSGPADFQQPGFAGGEWGAISFTTASDQTPLRVGILGDASFGDEATVQLVALMATQDLDFVIHTGDVVYETDSSDLANSYLLKFFQPFAPLLHQMPVYTVLGNHDYDAAVRYQGAPFYDYAFPPFPDPDFTYPETRRANQFYAFAYQGVQFLMLDSQTFYGVEGRAEQKDWLIERLTDPRFRFTIPVFHVAPYSSSTVHPDDGLPVRYTWNPIFEETNVPLSFSGHFHHYERLSANGITYIVSAGGSSVLYAQGNRLPESHIYVRRTHFVLMQIYPDRIQLDAIAKEGDIIDQVTIPLQ